MHRRRRSLGWAGRRLAALPSRLPLRLLGTTVLAAALAALLGLGVGPHLFHYRTLTMLTGSMRPGFPPGSVLIDRELPTTALRPGEVLTYQIPIDQHEVVSHRVISVQRGEGGWIVRTRGDANNGPDPWRAVITSPAVWTARADLPDLGFAIGVLREPAVHQLVLYAVPALLTGWVLLGIWKEPRRGGPA